MNRQDANKRVMLDFYENVVNRRDFPGTAKYLGPNYI